MNGHDLSIRRRQVMQGLRDSCDQTLTARVARYLEVGYQEIVPNHHFAAASSECIDLYRDGFFLSAVMVSHAVNEGIWKFVLDRNDIPREGPFDDQVRTLPGRGIVSRESVEAFARIWGSFRNDVHHMNPQVSSIPFEALAKRNLKDLALVEREIFATSTTAEGLVPTHPQYWDLGANGVAQAFLRFD